MLKYAAIGALVGLMGSKMIAQPSKGCDPSSPRTPVQTERRREGVTLARQINTAQAIQRQITNAYTSLSGLKSINVPAGFDVQVLAEGSSYAVSIKDAQDPCRVALFSDQNGVIYGGAPLQ